MNLSKTRKEILPINTIHKRMINFHYWNFHTHSKRRKLKNSRNAVKL